MHLLRKMLTMLTDCRYRYFLLLFRLFLLLSVALFSADVRLFNSCPSSSVWKVIQLGFVNCSFGPYFVEPVIAGLDDVTGEPFVASLDLIGCPMVTEDFVVSGTCSEQMYGMCESVWSPDLVSPSYALISYMVSIRDIELLLLLL